MTLRSIVVDVLDLPQPRPTEPRCESVNMDPDGYATPFVLKRRPLIDYATVDIKQP